MPYNDFGNSPFYLTPAQKQQLAKYKAQKDAENPNYFTEIPKQLVGGFIQGFTTLNPIDEPQNVVGGLARSVGSLMGFLGYVPGPGLAGKLGLSSVLKASGMAKALGWERRLGTPLMEGKALIHMRSVPMQVADSIMGLGEKFYANNKAAEAALKVFTKGDLVPDVLRSGIHLGIASAVSAAQPWEIHVKERMEGFTSGFSLGAFNKLAGNLIQTDAKLDLSKMFQGTEVTTALGREKVNALARMVAGGLYMGLPATLEGMPLPIQLYDYVLGGYFGYKETDAKHTNAMRYERKHSRVPSMLFGRESDPEYQAFPQETKDIIDADANLILGKLRHDAEVGWVSDVAIVAAQSGVRAFEKLEMDAKEPAEKRKFAAMRDIWQMKVGEETQKKMKLEMAIKGVVKEKYDTYYETGKKEGLSDDEAEKRASLQTQRELGDELKRQKLVESETAAYGTETTTAFMPTSQYTTVNELFGEKYVPIGQERVKVSKIIGKPIAELAQDWDIPAQFHVPTEEVLDKLRTIPELTKNWDEVEKSLGALLGKHTKLFKTAGWDVVKSAEDFIEEYKEFFVRGRKLASGKDVPFTSKDERNIIGMFVRASQNELRDEVRYSTDTQELFGKEGRQIQGDPTKPFYTPNVTNELGENDPSYGPPSFMEDSIRRYHEWKSGIPGGDRGVNVTLKQTADGTLLMEWLAKDGEVMFDKRVSALTFDALRQAYIPVSGVKTKGIFKLTKPVLEYGDEEDHYYSRVEQWMEKTDKPGYEKFKADAQKFVDDNVARGLDIHPDDAMYLWKRGVSNQARLVEILNGNVKGDGLTFEEILSDPRFIQGVDKFNKYFQVLDDPSYSIHDRAFASIRDAVPIMGLSPGASMEIVKGFNLNYLILKATNTDHPHNTEDPKGGSIEYLLKKGIITEEYSKYLRDGGIHARSDVQNVFHRFFGMDLKSGGIKVVIFDNSQPMKGAVLGKQEQHPVTRKLDKWMWKNKMHFLMYDTTVKQAGKRDIYEATWNDKRESGEEFDFFGPTGKVDPIPETIPVSGIKVNISSSEDYQRSLEDTSWKMALMSNLQNSANVQQMWDENYAQAFTDSKEWDAYLEAYHKDPNLQFDGKTFDLDKLSVQQKIDGITGRVRWPEKALRAYVDRLIKIGPDMSELEERDTESEEVPTSIEDPRYRVPAKRVLQLVDKITPKLLESNFIWPYLEGALKNDIRHTVFYPTAKESMRAVIAPIEHTMEHLVKEGEFWISRGAAEKPIKHPVSGEWTTVWKVFREYEKSKDEKLLSKLTPLLQRVPTSSLSAPRVLKLTRILDTPGVSVYLHPRDIRSMDTADTDGDNAYVYWAAPEGVKSEVLAEKDRYVRVIDGKSIAVEPVAPHAYKFLPDPVTGQEHPEYVKHQLPGNFFNIYEKFKSALWGYEGQQNVGSQINYHQQQKLLKMVFPNGFTRDITNRENSNWDDYSRQIRKSTGTNATGYVDTRMRQMGLRGLERGDHVVVRDQFPEIPVTEADGKAVTDATLDATKGRPVKPRRDLQSAVENVLGEEPQIFIRRSSGVEERLNPQIEEELRSLRADFNNGVKIRWRMRELKRASRRGMIKKTVFEEGNTGRRKEVEKIVKVGLPESVRATRKAISNLPLEMSANMMNLPSIELRLAERFSRLEFNEREMIAPVNKVVEQTVRNMFSDRYDKLWGSGTEEALSREPVRGEELGEEEKGKQTMDTKHSLIQEGAWIGGVNIKFRPTHLYEMYVSKGYPLEKAVSDYRQLTSQDLSDMAHAQNLEKYAWPLLKQLYDEADVRGEIDKAASGWDAWRPMKAATRQIRMLADRDRYLIAVKNWTAADIKSMKSNAPSKEFLLESGKLDYEKVQRRIQEHQKMIREQYGENGENFYNASLISSIHAQVSPEALSGGRELLQRLQPLLASEEVPMKKLDGEITSLIGETNLWSKKGEFTYIKGGELVKLEAQYGGRVDIQFQPNKWKVTFSPMQDTVGETIQQKRDRGKIFTEKVNEVILKAEEKSNEFKTLEATRDAKKKEFYRSNQVVDTLVQPLVSDEVIKSFADFYSEIGDIMTDTGVNAIKRAAKMIGMDNKLSISVTKQLPSMVDGTAGYANKSQIATTVQDAVSAGLAIAIEKSEGDVGFDLKTPYSRDMYNISKVEREYREDLKKLGDDLYAEFVKRPWLLSNFDMIFAGLSKGTFGGEALMTATIPTMRKVLNGLKSFPSGRFPLIASDWMAWLERTGETHREHGDQIATAIRETAIWSRGKVEMQPVVTFFSHMDMLSKTAIDVGASIDQNDSMIGESFKKIISQLRKTKEATNDVIDIDTPSAKGDFREIWAINVDKRMMHNGTWTDAEGVVKSHHPDDDPYIKRGKEAEKKWREKYQDGEKEYRVPIGGKMINVKAKDIMERSEFTLREILLPMLNTHIVGSKDIREVGQRYIKKLGATQFIDSPQTASRILNDSLNEQALPFLDLNTVGSILDAQNVDNHFVYEQGEGGWKRTDRRIVDLPEAIRADYLYKMSQNEATSWVVWKALKAHDVKTYYPMRNQPEESKRKARIRQAQKDLGLDAPFNPETATEIELKQKEWGEREALPDKGISEKIWRGWEISELEPEKVTNDLTSSRHLRELEVPPEKIPVGGWDSSPEVLLDEFRAMNKIRGNLLVQALHHEVVRDYRARNVHGQDTKQWSNFMEQYTRQVIGAPSYFPKEWMSDPEMHLKKNVMWYLSDQAVAQAADAIGKRTFMGKPLFEIVNESDTPIGALSEEGLKQRIARGQIYKKAVVDQRITEFTGLMMKTNAAALLFHTRGWVNNLFGGTLLTGISTGIAPLVNARRLPYLQKSLKVTWPTEKILGRPEEKGISEKQIMPIRNWHDVRTIVATHAGIESFINEEVLAKSGLSWGQVKAFTNELGELWRNDVDVKNVEAWRTLAKKHKVADSIFEIAMVPMRSSERVNRETAWVAHYLNAREILEINNVTEYDTMHPWLVEMANKGVRATQFLYNNASRPPFAATSLGRVFAQFQLWGWNSVRFNMRITKEAEEAGYRPGTEEYERFKRLATANAFVLGLALMFPASMFEAGLPAPWNWFKDLAAWIFGDDTDKESAFYGSMPYPMNIIQMVAPPSSRYVTDVFNVLVGGEGSMDKFLSYKVWTWFPFGRAARDVSGLLENPVMAVEKTTGFPLHGLQKEVKLQKRNPYATTGSLMSFIASGAYSEPEEEVKKP